MLPLAWLALFLFGNYLLYQIYPELYSTLHLLLETSQETVLTISATAHYAYETVQPVLSYNLIDTRASEQVVEFAHHYAPLVEEYFCSFTPTEVVDTVFVVASPIVLGGEQVDFGSASSGSGGMIKFQLGLGLFVLAIAGSLLFGALGMVRNFWTGRATDRQVPFKTLFLCLFIFLTRMVFTIVRFLFLVSNLIDPLALLVLVLILEVCPLS